MPETWFHLLQDPLSRRVVIDAICLLFKRWRLHPINQAELLGLSDMSELEKYASPDTAPQVFARIGHLLAIERALLAQYPYQAKLREQWVWQVQSQLDKQTPMALMLREGLDGIKLVRYMLESQKAA